MSIVAQKYDYVIGIDTHARTHTYTIVETKTGTITGPEVFPTSKAGIRRALAWIGRNSNENTIAGVEGVRSYGANIAAALKEVSILVSEVRPPRKKSRAGVGKTDAIDSLAAAQSLLGRQVAKLSTPRDSEGIRAGLATLLVARKRVSGYRTIQLNALNALVRTNDLGIDGRRALTPVQVRLVAAWKVRKNDCVSERIARAEAVYLARSIKDLERQLNENRVQVSQLCDGLAPGMQDEVGFGPVTVAMILVAYSHKGRCHSEAAFAALAGVAPLQASSGNTIRHRLNRYGDRQLNAAFEVVAMVKMRCDEQTKEYCASQLEQGKNSREIRRKIKRYLARSTFRKLQKFEIGLDKRI